MILNRHIIFNLTVEFGPLLTFFILSEPLGFIRAVVLFMAATVAAVIMDLVVQRRFAVFPVVVAGFILMFGGATVLSGNPKYIELNYTAYPLVFGLTAFIDLVFLRNRIFKNLFSSVFAIQDRGWYLTTRNWIFVFAAMAVANEFARRALVPEDWVLFRIGVSLLLLIFAGYQFTIARAYRLPEANEYGLRVL